MLTDSQILFIEELWREFIADGSSAVKYAKSMHTSRPFLDYLGQLDHLGFSGETVIDAGCGTGTYSFAFLRRFNKVLGFDYTEERVELARRLAQQYQLEQITFRQADVTRLPVDDESADFVFCRQVVMSSLSAIDVLNEFRRVLRPGGACYISFYGVGLIYEWIEQRGEHDPKYRILGERSLYWSLWQNILKPALESLHGDRPSLDCKMAWAKASTLEAEQLFRGNCSALEAINAIRRTSVQGLLDKELREYILKTRADLSFSSSTGRWYEPNQVEMLARSVGFKKYAWAPQGELSVRSNGDVIKEPPINAQRHKNFYKAMLREWESVHWK